MKKNIIGVIVVITVAGVFLLHSRISLSRGHGKQPEIIAKLKHIAIEQELFKKFKIIDRNKDGIGEYGFLQELLRLSPLSLQNTERKRPYVLSFPYYKINNGILISEGYNYYFYLPGKTTAIGEKEGIRLYDSHIGTKQDRFWICYAWPESGKGEVFVINQEKEIFCFKNTNKRYCGHERIPFANAALNVKGKSPKNLDAPLGRQTCDGEKWICLSR